MIYFPIFLCDSFYRLKNVLVLILRKTFDKNKDLSFWYVTLIVSEGKPGKHNYSKTSFNFRLIFKQNAVLGLGKFAVPSRDNGGFPNTGKVNLRI